MKNNLIKAIIAILFVPTLSVFASGNSYFSITPSFKNVSVGSQFSVSVNINPEGSQIDTARAVVNFDESLLSANSVSLSGQLNTATPNNVINNSDGVVSWGGFAISNPITNPQSFIKIIFTAKSSGIAQISTDPSSRIVSAGIEQNTGTVSSSTINITAGDTQQPEGQSDLVVTSSTHPDPEVWYSKSRVELAWTGVPSAEYLIDLDQEPDTTPRKTTSHTSKVYGRLDSGLYFFHVQAQIGGAPVGPVVHFPIRIDTISPQNFSPYLSVEGEERNLIARFGTTDAHSGINHYEMSINGSNSIPVTSPANLTDIVGGENLVNIVAFDNAGNTTTGWIKFFVNEDGSIREIARSKSSCNTIYNCLSQWLTKPVFWGVLLLLILLLLFWIRRTRRSSQSN